MEADFTAIYLSQSLLLTSGPYVCRWSFQWRGEGQEGCREAPGGWDCTGVPAGLSRGGIRRQSSVSWPWSLSAQVWQLLFTMALQECLLQSVLHQISLDIDTGGSQGVCLFIYVWFVQWQATGVWVRERYRNYSWENHQRVTKRHAELDFGDWTKTWCILRYTMLVCHRAFGNLFSSHHHVFGAIT